MALHRSCPISGGGGMTETVLWENPNPSDPWTATSLSMSDTADNYDLLKIYYKSSYIDNDADILQATFPVSDLLKGSNFPIFICGYSSGQYARRIYVIDGNQSKLSTGTPAKIVAGSSATGGTKNTVAHPIKVSGIKL